MKYIIVSTLCFTFSLTTILFSWEATRRSAQEWAVINQFKYPTRAVSADIPVDQKIKSCIDGGGMPNYDSGTFVDCRTKQ